MRFSDVCLESFGYELPERVLSSQEIEHSLSNLYERIGSPRGKIVELTGVEERRLWPKETLPSTVAAKAAAKALAAAKIEPGEIDLIIHTGVCRDSLEPSTATLVHHNLGLSPHCMIFDTSNACLGFLNGMVIAGNMIEMKHVRRALVVTGENATTLYDDTIQTLLKEPTPDNFRKNLASLTLGSAAVAYVLTHKELSQTGHSLIGGVCQANTKAHNLCRGIGDLSHMKMETNTTELMKQGLSLAKITWELFTRNLGWNGKEIDHYIVHQVSKSHHQKICEILEINVEKSFSELPFLGNTGSAAAPLSLALAHEKQHLKKGERIAILGIGSGLHVMMLGVIW